MIRISTLSGAIALVSAFTVNAWGATSQQIRVPQIKFSEYRLANGLRVILSPDHSAPVVAISVTYNVGSRDERQGRTGFAHLFEHMMFQGSKNVGKGEHMMLVQDNGGTMNGTTNKDRTNFFEELPANQLDLVLFLEADRMQSLDISQTNLDNQRAVVEEEKRQSYDNQPYGSMAETLDALMYSNFPYKHTTIGSMADLDAATLNDVIEFHKTYYLPNNAVLALVGDFDEGTARRKIEKYFGGIARGPEPPPVDMSEPALTSEQRKTIKDPLARLVRYEASYKTVSGSDPDSYPLQILGSILSRGRTGRLYGAIIEKRLANNASAGGQMGRGVGLFTCSATLSPDASVKAVEDAFDMEITKIQTIGVTEEEMSKARIQAMASLIVGGGGGRRRGGGGGGGLQSALNRANELAQDAVFYNDPARINNNLAKLQAVTAEDVRRVANKYLVKTNRVVLTVVPDAPVDNGFGGQ